MGAFTLGTCTEHNRADGLTEVQGTATGPASYDPGGSVLDLSSVLKKTCQGIWVFDESGEFTARYIPTAGTYAPATCKIKVAGISWDDVALTHASGFFNAAATTDNDVIWAQPATSECVGMKVTLTEKFAATSLTNLTIEIGDSGDHNGLFAGTIDLVTGTVGDTDETWGAEIGDWANAYAATATDRYLWATATGANLNTLTTGECTVRCYFTPKDYTTGTVGAAGYPEVHSGQVLSSKTFRFIAWGTDA